MEIGSFRVIERVAGTQNFYFVAETRFDSTDVVLLKTYARGASVTDRSIEEAHLLSGLKLSTLRVIDHGHDEKLGVSYCAMLVPGRFVPLSLDPPQHVEGARFSLATAKAIRDLNGQGVAYRNFALSAFGRLNGSVIPYDYSRAVSFRVGRVQPRFATLETFDPPEAQSGEYDLVRGEVYGLGILMRQLSAANSPVWLLAKRATSPLPVDRPNSVEELVQEFETLLLS